MAVLSILNNILCCHLSREMIFQHLKSSSFLSLIPWVKLRTHVASYVKRKKYLLECIATHAVLMAAAVWTCAVHAAAACMSGSKTTSSFPYKYSFPNTDILWTSQQTRSSDSHNNCDTMVQSCDHVNYIDLNRQTNCDRKNQYYRY